MKALGKGHPWSFFLYIGKPVIFYIMMGIFLFELLYVFFSESQKKKVLGHLLQ